MLTTPDPLGAVAPAQPVTAVSGEPPTTGKVPVTDDADPPEPPESLLAAPPPPPPTPPLVEMVTRLAMAGAVAVDWIPHAWVSVQLDSSVVTCWPKEYWSAGTGVVVPLGVVTVMSTVPVPGGAVAVTDVDESAVMTPAACPKSTEVAFSRLVPVMVTLLPPPTGPVSGLTAVRTGAGVVRE